MANDEVWLMTVLLKVYAKSTTLQNPIDLHQSLYPEHYSPEPCFPEPGIYTPSDPI